MTCLQVTGPGRQERLAGSLIVDYCAIVFDEAEFAALKADRMASEITASGEIALYEILLEYGQRTLDETGALLKANAPARLLIVGHTKF